MDHDKPWISQLFHSSLKFSFAIPQACNVKYKGYFKVFFPDSPHVHNFFMRVLGMIPNWEGGLKI